MSSSTWVFGYGSLIWKPQEAYLSVQPAVLSGWSRRFWQGSHDHRGTPEQPGRVVTLVADATARCEGLAFEFSGDVIQKTFEDLDHREKNGYERADVDLQFTSGAVQPAITYIAHPGNFAWAGAAPEPEIARQIASSHGPSGSNMDYLIELAQALRQHQFTDSHVFELERQLRMITSEP